MYIVGSHSLGFSSCGPAMLERITPSCVVTATSVPSEEYIWQAYIRTTCSVGQEEPTNLSYNNSSTGSRPWRLDLRNVSAREVDARVKRNGFFVQHIGSNPNNQNRRCRNKQSTNNSESDLRFLSMPIEKYGMIEGRLTGQSSLKTLYLRMEIE